MPPQVALLIGYGLIFWLFRKDAAWRPEAGSRVLWIPGAWIGIQGSRPVSYWFGSRGDTTGEGNPINTVIFAAFIVAGFVVLSKRNLSWGAFFRDNKALCAIYLYLCLSAVWSEMPLATFKRALKDFGCVLMALIFLTQADPAKAVRMIYVRVAYVLFPLSVIFIKFFPSIGRQANRAGDNMFTGITTQKNSLGEMVFVLGLVIVWDLVEIYRSAPRKGRRLQLGIRLSLLLMGCGCCAPATARPPCFAWSWVRSSFGPPNAFCGCGMENAS
jgi:exopolysaccharide production protein ExoQ